MTDEKKDEVATPPSKNASLAQLRKTLTSKKIRLGLLSA